MAPRRRIRRSRFDMLNAAAQRETLLEGIKKLRNVFRKTSKCFWKNFEMFLRKLLDVFPKTSGPFCEQFGIVCIGE
jgi:hypothetical protein